MTFEPTVKLYAPDTGELLFEKFAVAQQWRCLPDTVTKIASKHKVKRYAAQTGNGKPQHFYPESEVKRIAALRRGVVHIAPGDIVAVPYPDEVEADTEPEA